MQITYAKETLDNGLDVIVHASHECPIVAVNVWYHVGSKDEQPGRTGFAHLFEHLMFEGSQHYDRGYFHPLQRAGAAVNGSTNTDRTNYWEVVPANALELALWMESDRMGFLLPALTEAKFENQRDVVLNERRQNYENRPYGRAGMAIAAALFPPSHPYHWLTIGDADDLRAARFDDVRAFLRRFYHPANASLAIAGAVEPEATLRLARHYFGDLAAGPTVEPVAVDPPPPLAEDGRRFVLEDAVELPRIYMAWRSPALFAAGDAELDLLADLLSNGKASRLHRRLIQETGIATEVAAVQSSRELGSYFQVVATAAPRHTLEELDRAITVELERLASEGPTQAELERAQSQAEAQFVYRLQTLGGFGGISDQLNAYNVLVGDPGYFSSDLDRYRATTVRDLTRAASRHLSSHQRVVVSVVPQGNAAVALPESCAVTVC